MAFVEHISNWMVTNYSLMATYFVIALIIGLIVFVVVIYRLTKLAGQYKLLMRGVEGKNLEEIVLHNTKILEQVLLRIKVFEDRLEKVESLAQMSIHKVGVVRFNAFSDMGGDLSFAVALLDGAGDGVVISSIYGRNDARTYAKPIKDRKSKYQLNAEEEMAIQSALQGE